MNSRSAGQCRYPAFPGQRRVRSYVSDTYYPGVVQLRLERCPECGELCPIITSLGEKPVVAVRWRLRKSEVCEHLLVDFLEVASQPPDEWVPIRDGRVGHSGVVAESLGSPLTVTARMKLDTAERHRFRLPGADPGTRSLLFRFGETTYGAYACTSDGCEFTPGSSHDLVFLTFWAGDEARKVVKPDASFAVWYNGDVGHGEVVGS